MGRRKAEKWVRAWWADQMRKGNAPDFPNDFPDDFLDTWERESRRIADILDPPVSTTKGEKTNG